MKQTFHKIKPLQILGALLIAAVGASVVFLGLVVMNRIAHTPEAEDVGPSVSFEVPPPPPPPPQDRPEPPPRRSRPRTEPVAAPLPNLGSNLSGISVALPDFEAGTIDTVSEDLLGDLDDVALTDDAVDEQPSFQTRVPAEYPERARQREIEGSVVVSALIGVDGRVQQTQILESVPPGIFDQAALGALNASTFEPGSYRGEPVEVWVEVPYNFSLN